jgi:polyphosphate kinase
MSLDPFVNRELWWLEANSPLLDQARDAAAPPLARLRSLGAVSASLDEFFMRRVPALKRMALHRPQVSRRVRELVEAQRRCFLDGLRDRLARDGIVLLEPRELSRRQHYFVEERFLAAILPVLTPLAAGPGHPFPFLGNRWLSLLVSTRPAVASALPHSELSIVHLPSQALPRFIAVPDPLRPRAFMLLEDVVRLHLPTICHGYDILSSHAIRVTRETAPTDPPSRGRRRGMAVRLQVDDQVPSHILALLRDELGLSDEDIYVGAGTVALSALPELHAAIAGLRRSRPRPTARPSTSILERPYHVDDAPALAEHP